MYAFKGFEQDLTCRGYQYAPGRTFTLAEGAEPELCRRGFHACILPIQVLHYYGNSQDAYYFVNVDKLAKIDKGNSIDSKICGGEIMIGEESIHDVVAVNAEVVDTIWRTIRAEVIMMTPPADEIKYNFALHCLTEARNNLKKQSALSDTNLALYVTDGFWHGLCLLHDSLGETSAYGDFNNFLEIMTWQVKELFR